MRPSFLIDTDWIIHYLNGNGEFVKKLKTLEKEGLAVSVISLAELSKEFFTRPILLQTRKL